MNPENLKRINYEKKTTLLSLKNINWKPETEKINKLFAHILAKNITELNELIYALAKVVCEKIGVPQKARTEIEKLVEKFDWKRK